MIQITFYVKPGNQIRGFQVIGHADSVKDGADLVCCSVSVLTINLVNSLEKLTPDRYEETQQEQMGLIQCIFQDKVSEKAELLLASYRLGVEEIAREYGDWLTVTQKEV